MEPIHLISLGAGVQSSCMALMAACGEIIPMPQAAIFADTQAEPQSVYRWLDWLEKQLPFPVHRVTAGSLTAKALEMKRTKDGRLYSKTDIPFFTRNNETGEQGMVSHRSCTADFKIKPLLKKARELASVKRGEKQVKVIQWIGISLDEMLRMKPSRDKWAACRWPLIEMRFTRQRCLEWMRDKGFPEPPRSACVYCPFHSNAEWRRLQVEEPEEFQRAVQFENDIQRVKSESSNFSTTPYLTRSCKPLREIDFRSLEERGQQVFAWQDECTGMCGN
jgi:hypothetical protein